MKRRSGGYTIIEVMIFLVVTATLLISAMAVFNGRQGRTEYVQSVRETDQQILTIINEVATGYFPDQGNFSCQLSLGGPVIDDSEERSQGTNEDCVFLGKMILFDNNNPGQYRVYPIAGNRLSIDLSNLTVSLADAIEEAKPTPVASLVQTYNVPYSNTISKVVDPSKPCTQNSALSGIAFMQSLGEVSNGDPISGSQSVDKFTLCPGSIGENNGNLFINVTNDWTTPAKETTLCFDDGPNNLQSAITIGNASGKLNTEVLIDNQPPECS